MGDMNREKGRKEEEEKGREGKRRRTRERDPRKRERPYDFNPSRPKRNEISVLFHPLSPSKVGIFLYRPIFFFYLLAHRIRVKQNSACVRPIDLISPDASENRGG